MRVLGTSVLAFQAIVLALFIPVGVTTSWGATAGWIGAALVLLCVVAIGLLRSPVGVAVGWAVQVLTIATGFIVPAMFGLGALFAALWWAALKYGRQADQMRAERESAGTGATDGTPPADQAPPADGVGSGPSVG